MKRPVRITVELLSPGFIAAFLYSAVSLAISRDTIFATVFLMFLMFAYVFSAIPSVVFTVLMEFAFARGLEERSWRAVSLASGLGTLCGVVIALIFAGGFDNRRGAFTVFPVLGLLTGGVVGLTVYMFAKKRPNQALLPTPMSVTDRAAHAPRQP
jgi:hypothetical protein